MHAQRRTLNAPITMHGIGLHSGRAVSLTLVPAHAGFGVVFRRLDWTPGQGDIPALHTYAVPSALSTRLVNTYGASVGTIEHLMAALHAHGVTDALITLSGEEVPILDGSAHAWSAALRTTGTHPLGVAATLYTVTRPVHVQRGAAWARLVPSAQLGLSLSCRIDFADPAIGQQAYQGLMTLQHFDDELAAARTFCRHDDIATMHAQGLALGGSIERAVIFDHDRVLNPEGLRFADEPVRHKALDVVGDLYLTGGFLQGRFEANRPGHALTGALLAQAFATPGCLRSSLSTTPHLAEMVAG